MNQNATAVSISQFKTAIFSSSWFVFQVTPDKHTGVEFGSEMNPINPPLVAKVYKVFGKTVTWLDWAISLES